MSRSRAGGARPRVLRPPRSPFLASTPPSVPPKRRCRQVLRTLGVAVIVAPVLLTLILVSRRLLPERGIGYLLYWAHDTFFLPFIGHFYLRAYPTSLVWWGVFATVASGLLAAFLSDRSLVRRVHVGVLRWLVHRKAIHPLLAGGARLFKALGVRPEMLIAVLEHERSQLLARLWALPAGSAMERDARALAALSPLLAAVRALPPAVSREELRALAECHEALLALQARSSRAASSLGRALEGLVTTLGGPAVAAGDPTVPADFDPATCLRDLADLAALAQTHAPHESIAAWFSRILLVLAGRRPPAPPPMPAPRMLAVAVEDRRHRLDAARAALEAELLGMNPALAGGASLAAAVTPADLPALGRLAVGIALHTALVSKAPDVALGFLDSVEALALTLEIIPPTAGGQTRLHAAALLGPEADDKPGALLTPEDYRLCLLLAERRYLCDQQETTRLAALDKSSLRGEDLTIAAARLRALAGAAGPTYDTLAGPGDHR